MDYQALKAELAAGHPGTGAYSANDETAAGELNVVNRTRNLASISGDDIFGATDGTEFSALTDVKKQLWVSFCGRDNIDPFGTSNVDFVQWIFGGGSTTVSNLTDIRKEDVSRAVELELGKAPNASHVAYARTL